MPDLRSQSRHAAVRLIPTVLLCGFGFCYAGAAEPNLGPARKSASPVSAATPDGETVHLVGKDTRRVEFTAGESLLLEYPDWLTSVTSQDPGVIRVSAVKPNRLRITRISQGMATLHAVDRRDHRYSIEVVVQPSADK